MKKRIAILLTAALIIAGITAKISYDKNHTPENRNSQEETEQAGGATPTPEPDPRIRIVADLLRENGSPLTDQADVFVNCGSDNGISPYLLVAITKVESSFGAHACGGNAWGWASCKVRHSSLEAGCQSVAEGIATAAPYARYRSTGRVADLAASYCPKNSGCDTDNWVAQVEKIISELEDREFIENMEDITQYLPAGKTPEQMQQNIETLKKLLEKASGTHKEVIEIIIRANERAIKKGGEQ